MRAPTAFSVLSQGLPLEAPGICSLRVRHRLRMVLGPTRAAGHLWHTLIQKGGEKAPNTAADYPNICLPCPSPARSPRPEQFKDLLAFPGRAGGVLEATGDGAERLLGPGALSTAHRMDSSSLWTRELTPRPVGQSGSLLSPFLGPSLLAHPTSYCFFLTIPGSSSS